MSATYPPQFAGMNLEAVNYALSQGTADESAAAQLVEWWNTSGKRMTRAELRHRTKPFGDRGMKIPYIVVVEDATENPPRKDTSIIAAVEEHPPVGVPRTIARYLTKSGQTAAILVASHYPTGDVWSWTGKYGAASGSQTSVIASLRSALTGRRGLRLVEGEDIVGVAVSRFDTAKRPAFLEMPAEIKSNGFKHARPFGGSVGREQWHVHFEDAKGVIWYYAGNTDKGVKLEREYAKAMKFTPQKAAQLAKRLSRLYKNVRHDGGHFYAESAGDVKANGPARMVPGDSLSRSDQNRALASYVHRFTKTHRPAWAERSRNDGTAYPVQFADDAEWLKNTLFAVKSDGSLDARFKHVVSTPTWPDNPELRR